jgi:hypothetical protein
MSDPCTIARVDQLRAMARDLHPDRSPAWRDAWIARMAHYLIHRGDMSTAPPFPEDD